MLRKETITKELETVLSKLMQLKSLHNYRLVGGTALALQLGHRKSIDIDLFSDKRNDYDKIFKALQNTLKAEIKSHRYFKHGLSLNITGIKVDLFDWDTFIREPIESDSWRIAHKEDIAAMKIDTLMDRPDLEARYEKKDFVDIACLLKEFNIERMIQLYFIKYPDNLLNDRIILERLSRFDRAETQMPVMLNGQTWEITQEIIIRGIDEYYRSKGINTEMI